MANELPYFRFVVQAWQNGKIDIERNELKGMYISICGYYWVQDCNITLALLHKKFPHDHKLIDELIQLDIIKHDKRSNLIEISFLDEQFDLLSSKRKRRQDAGSKGGNATAKTKQKLSYKNKIIIKEDNDNDKKLVFPYDSQKFMETWNILTNEPKWRKKTIRALQSNLNTLGDMGGEDVALQSMLNALNNGWQGVFHPNGRSNVKNDTETSKLTKLTNAHSNAKKRLNDSFENDTRQPAD